MPFPNPSTQFQPGQSGNPKGRPRKRPLSDLLAEKLEQGSGDGATTWDERLVTALLETAATGDVAAIKEVFNRIEGKVPDSLTIGAEAPRGVGSLRDFLHGGPEGGDDPDGGTAPEA